MRYFATLSMTRSGVRSARLCVMLSEAKHLYMLSSHLGRLYNACPLQSAQPKYSLPGYLCRID